MSKFRFAAVGLLSAAAGLIILPSVVGIAPAAYAQALRPEIGNPLKQAQELLRARKYKEALAKIRETDSIGGKTPNEVSTIERMRASAASSAGEYAVAAKAFETVVDTGRLPAAEQLKYIQAIAGNYYQAKDYAKSATWLTRYFQEGGDDPQMRELLLQTYFLSGDYAKSGKEARAAALAAEKAGKTPSEASLQMWANTASRLNDKAGYLAAIEKLVACYPKKEYWTDLLNRAQGKPGMDRLALDLLRLKLAAGQLTKAGDYMEMAQLALQAGFPAEAIKVIDQGYKTGALGTGADAERHKRLKDMATKKLAESKVNIARDAAEADASPDGAVLVNVGFAYVTMGQADTGLGLIVQGIKKEGMKRPGDARLHQGIAQLQAGRKPDAVQTFKSVKGDDAVADLSRYWAMLAARPIN